MKRTILFLTATGALTVFGVSGCATKGFVNNEIREVREDMGASHEEMHLEIDGVRESVSKASEASDKALTTAMDAQEKIDRPWTFREVDVYTVNFAFDSSALSDEAMATLGRVAAALGENPGHHVDVYGHADPSGDESYNDWLSELRAKAVVRYLVTESGVSLARITIIGMGESEPLAAADASRRVSIHIMEPGYHSMGDQMTQKEE